MKSSSARLSILICLVLAVLHSGVSGGEEAKKPAPSQPEFEHRLVVKFKDVIRARAKNGALSTLSTRADLICQRLVRHNGAKFNQLLQLEERKLIELSDRAFAKSGRTQPDLASIIVVDAPTAELQAIADSLHKSKDVDWVEFEMVIPPPPIFDGGDIPPTTPDYVPLQGYRGQNPGLNVDNFWQRGDARGEEIQFADCEYWFNPDHEELCGVIPEPGQTPNPQVIANGWHEHGTAALGGVIGGENGFGIVGIAPAATAFFFLEWTIQEGGRRATAIANAAATLDAGDVMLLEMQTSIGFGFGPAELNQSVWNVVKQATDAGIIVVAAAGNGDQNLDGSVYSDYNARGDSGAIIVGAGTADVSHDKLWFSTYGSRVDVQAWGSSVFTSGYGAFAELGGDENQRYTGFFSGTSSASGLIAGVCTALQGYAVANIGRRLTPPEMKQMFAATGWPQGAGGNIGRFPDMEEAADWVLTLVPEFELGDVNRDESVNLADIPVFVELISSGKYQLEADINGDDSVDLADIPPFVLLLSGN